MHETRTSSVNGERSLASIIAEIREELKELVNTRVSMFRSELRETTAALKAGIPMLMIAAVFLATAYLLLTAALVAVVSVTFAGSPYAWFYSFLIVGFVWLMIGGIAGILALHRFREHGFFPKRTVEVLKADKAWIQNELRGSV
ncbi:MAG: phage holin family protein [Acidobacteriaceae bacterium]|nr:phage holin family protein [Acidobacteriaceae bacterium]